MHWLTASSPANGPKKTRSIILRRYDKNWISFARLNYKTTLTR